MLGTIFRIMSLDSLTDQSRRKEAVCSLKSKDLMAAMLYGSCFMYIYMSCSRAENALIWTEDRRYHGSIGLRASDKEMHIHIFPADGLSYCGTGHLAIMVLTISDSLLEIGLHKALHYPWMRTFIVVTLELIHSIGD